MTTAQAQFPAALDIPWQQAGPNPYVPNPNGVGLQQLLNAFIAPAITALEAKVGINGSTDPTSLDYRVSQVVGNTLMAPTVSGLRGMSVAAVSANTPLFLLGYYAAGDAGAVVLIWNPTDSRADNGGTILKPTSVSGAGRWNALSTGTIRPEQFGAVGNGTTSDSAALQAAITWVAANGGILLLGNSNSVYRITSTLSIPANVSMTGFGCMLLCQDADNLQDIVQITGSNVTLVGIVFQHNRASASAVGIDVQANVSVLSVVQCGFSCASGNFMIGINMSAAGCGRIQVDDCWFDSVLYGVLVQLGAATLVGLDVTNCRFNGMYSDCVEVNTPNGAYSGASKITVANCFCNNPNGSTSNGGLALGFAGASYVSILGNTILGSRYQGIHTEAQCREFTVKGNVLQGTVTTNPTNLYNSGMYFSDTVDLTVVGNTCRGWAQCGIQLVYDATHYVQHAVISDNVCTGNGAHGIYHGAATFDTDVNIHDNTCQGNTGSGIAILGTCYDVSVHDNRCSGNSRYGVEFSGQPSGVEYRGNKTYNNTLGRVLWPTSSPIIGKDDSFVVDTTFTSHATPTFNGIYLGKMASGTYSITIRYAGGPYYYSVLYTITWDGSSLVKTQVTSTGFGDIYISGSPTMSGNFIQVTGGTGGGVADGSDLQIEAEFVGTVVNL